MIYGHDKTIHNTKLLNIEIDLRGHVVAVWFRCLALPFDQTKVDDSRAEELRRMYENVGTEGCYAVRKIVAIEVQDPEPDAQDHDCPLEHIEAVH